MLLAAELPRERDVDALVWPLGTADGWPSAERELEGECECDEVEGGREDEDEADGGCMKGLPPALFVVAPVWAFEEEDDDEDLGKVGTVGEREDEA